MFVIQHLRCRRVRRLLWDHLAERLSEGPLEMVERHLSECPRCRREAAGLRQAQAILQACRREPTPSPRTQWHTLRARLQDGPPPMAPRGPVWPSRLVATGGFAAALLAIAVTVRLSLPVGSLQYRPTASADHGALVVSSPPKPVDRVAPLMHPPQSRLAVTRKATPATDAGESVFQGVGLQLAGLWGPYLVPTAPSEKTPAHKGIAPKMKSLVRHSRTPEPRPQLVAAHGPNGETVAPGGFHHYNPRPEDRLPTDSNSQDQGDVDVQMQQVGNDGGYVIEPLRPDDNETPY
jgi:hypothetical protein